MKPSDNTDVPDRAWIEQGILYVEFRNDFSLKSILKMEADSLALIQEQHIEYIPVIVFMGKSVDQKVALGVTDFAKILNSVEIIKHLSSISIVGAGEHIKKIIGLFNQMFFSGRIHFFDTFKEAQAEAKATQSASLSILE